MQHLKMHKRKNRCRNGAFQSPEKYDEAIAQNGELTQADVDQANTDAEEAKSIGGSK